MSATSPRVVQVDADPGRSVAAQSLLDRLDDPQTAAALHQLLDNAELLAMGATMIEELLRRSETIAGNVSSTLAEVRSAAGPGLAGAGSTAADLGALLPSLVTALPQLTALLDGPLLKAQSTRSLEQLVASLSEGLEEARRAPDHKPGIRALLGELRDPDTARGLSALLAVARSLGRRVTG